jgi:hypothetical protein
LPFKRNLQRYIAVELARVLHSLGSADRAEATLDEMMRDHPVGAVGLGFRV